MIRLILASCCVVIGLPPSAVAENGNSVLAPLAFVKFCSKLPAECERRGPASVELDVDPVLRDLLQRINRGVNVGIEPDGSFASVSDIQDWYLGPTRGDCNAYAVTKRHALISGGLPTSAVRLAAVVTADGQDHMIVVIKAKGGDLALDNLNPDIVPFRETGYLLMKEQSGLDPKVWVRSD